MFCDPLIIIYHSIESRIQYLKYQISSYQPLQEAVDGYEMLNAMRVKWKCPLLTERK